MYWIVPYQRQGTLCLSVCQLRKACRTVFYDCCSEVIRTNLNNELFIFTVWHNWPPIPSITSQLTHHADSHFLLQGSAAEQPPDRWEMGTKKKRAMRMKIQVGMKVVGTGSSGWVQLMGSSARGSGLSWNCCCCACCPFHSRSETPPSPCIEAGRAPHLQAGCDPTREVPGTGCSYLLHFHQNHLLHSHYCYYCWQLHCHSSRGTHPKSLHQGLVYLCLTEKKKEQNKGE